MTEECYRLTDRESGMTGFYNANGDLIESRQATADELQGNLFSPPVFKKTGTDDAQPESRVL